MASLFSVRCCNPRWGSSIVASSFVSSSSSSRALSTVRSCGWNIARNRTTLSTVPSLSFHNSNMKRTSTTTAIATKSVNSLYSLVGTSVNSTRLPVWNGTTNVGALSACFSTGSNLPPPLPPPVPRPNRWAQGVGFMGAASLLFGKTKYVLAALKVTKLASLGSMVVSIGAYSMVFGWPYAVGMVGLIFVHECGHAAVMHARGLPFSPMVFIPFMGAVIATKEHPRDAWEDAVIAAGGPIAGSLAAGLVAGAASVTQSPLLFALADFGYMINLFNLLPIGSMDGGRWTGALSKYAGVAGSALGGYICYTGVVANPLFYLIWLAGSYETFQRLFNPQHHLPPNFYHITTGQRALLTTGYFGLIAVLLVAMEANRRNKKSPERLMRERGGEITWDTRFSED